MAAEKAPAFQFYPKDFLTDGRVAGMTLQEVGAYIRLLCLCWQESSLPNDTKRLATMVGATHMAFLKVWPAIAECFHEQDGRLVQRRLDRERVKQAAYRQLQSRAGKASAAKRAKATGVQPTRQPNRNGGSTGVQPSGQPNGNSAISDLQSSISDLPSPVCDLLAPAKTETAFARFWANYPNKKGKDDALKAWNRRHPSEALIDLILSALSVQKTWPEWTKDGGRFIPHPATWLNRGSWDDEPALPLASRVSDVGRQNAANAEVALQMLEEHDAVQR